MKGEPLEPGLQSLFETAGHPKVCFGWPTSHLLLALGAPTEASKGPPRKFSRLGQNHEKNDFPEGSAQEPPEASKESPGAGSSL